MTLSDVVELQPVLRLGVRITALLTFFGLAACSPGSQLPNVAGQPVPTAVFVFFDQDSGQPQAESEGVVREAAAFLVQYDNTVARVVGHVARDETLGSDPKQRIDAVRAATIGGQLISYGVPASRIQALSAGRSESLAKPGDDPSIDRRVDIIFGTTSVR